jgi:beta-lactamase regulating signal transducer with metallopeptidase domain
MSLLNIGLPEMIGLTILHSLWQITLLWIVLVAMLRLCPKASSAVRYTFAISILMLAVLTTAATAVYEWQLHATSDEISVLSSDITQTLQTVHVTASQTLLSRIIDTLNASVPLLAWLWCAGLVVMGTRFGGSFFYLRTLRAQKNIAATSPFWEQELKRLSRALGLRCEVAIATSARVSSPLTLGSISPIILLPTGLLSGMSTAQLEAILIHELYHIKRRDYIINICQALVEVVLFYHPAIWHINHIIREERENCCDDQTVAFCGDAIAYARALTQIQNINALTKPTLAMSATGPKVGNFTNRIKRLFNKYPNPAQARSKGILAIGFLIVYLCIVLVSAYVSTAQPVEPEKKPMKTSVSDKNAASNIFSDSIPVSNHLNVLDSKETTPPHMEPVAGEKVRSMDIQRADTTLRNQTLDECIKQFRRLVGTASLFRFSKFSAGDSLHMYRSTDFVKLLPTMYGSTDFFKLFPTRVHGTFNPSRRAKLDLTDSAGNETTTEPIELKIPAVQVFPNSTTGSLNIRFTPSRNNSRVEMILVDSNGKVVKEITDSTYDNIPKELHIDVSGYTKGVYILQINIDGTKSQQRVVVE